MVRIYSWIILTQEYVLTLDHIVQTPDLAVDP